jgi:hypothetical protein
LFYGAETPRAAARAQMLARARVQADAAAPAAAPLGLKYTVLRRLPEGEFAETAPDQLAIGDTVRVRFVPNDNGYLYLMEKQTGGGLRQLHFARLEREKPHEATLSAVGEAGSRELLVMFSRRSLGAIDGAAPLNAAEQVRTSLIRATSSQKSETDARERSTYVVNAATDPGAQQVTFPITLKYR